MGKVTEALASFIWFSAGTHGRCHGAEVQGHTARGGRLHVACKSMPVRHRLLLPKAGANLKAIEALLPVITDRPRWVASTIEKRPHNVRIASYLHQQTK